MVEASLVKLPQYECHWTSLMISQHWFRWGLRAIRQQAITWANFAPYPILSQHWFRWGLRAIRQQAITWANFAPDPCRHMLSLGHNKQRVLMHRHQGWNVRHGLCHIYMRYVYIYMSCLYLFLLLFVHYCNLMVCVVFWVGKWQSRGSTGMFGNLMDIYHIMLQFIQSHSRFVMLMIWK